MDSNKDRLIYLRKQLQLLTQLIEQNGKEEAYIQLTKDISDNTIEFKPLTDEEWEIMTSKEQDFEFLRYYHTLRCEYQELLKEHKLAKDKVSWLESKWISRPLTIYAIVEATVQIIHILHTIGIFYEVEGEDIS